LARFGAGSAVPTGRQVFILSILLILSESSVFNPCSIRG